MKAKVIYRGRRRPAFHRGRIEAEPGSAAVREHSICRLCGSVYAHKAWRSVQLAQGTPVSGVNWTGCPACRKLLAGEGKGRVLIRGIPDEARLQLVQRRIRNVAARARFTQPERRLVRMKARGLELDVVTTSQELAHRIGREIDKAFGAHTTYSWSGREKALDAFCDLRSRHT